jgi:hypothetical protein
LLGFRGSRKGQIALVEGMDDPEIFGTAVIRHGTVPCVPGLSNALFDLHRLGRASEYPLIRLATHYAVLFEEW